LLHPSFETAFAHGIYKTRYSFDGREEWSGTAARVVGNVMGALPRHAKNVDAAYRVNGLFEQKLALPGGRYLYASGRPLHQVNNCLLMRCEDSREGWSTLSYQAEMALMTGAGIGVWYGDLRPSNALISKTGGRASGPIPKMCQINDTGRHVESGGNRRSAIWAGLSWSHPDIFEFITIKDWPDEIRALKEADPTFPATMDYTNISVGLDDEFFAAMNGHPVVVRDWNGDLQDRAPNGSLWGDWARDVYDTAVAHMVRHGEPGFSISTGATGHEVLRNACTEITSADDSDVCNLGSMVLPRFNDPQQFGAAVRDMTLFLLAGTLYSDVPYEKVAEVREQNRRLGLGVIGVHEFLMRSGVRYGTDEAEEVLEPYAREYARSTEYAWDWADKLGISRPVATRAIAPNGTIGILAESTPSADPMFSAAEVRTVIHALPNGNRRSEHPVLDPVAERMLREGVSPDLIEDAYTIEPDRRLRMQAFLQRYVDQSISSTVNLPAQIFDPREADAFGDTLLKYLPDLKGITVYPDGARAGQPRKPISVETALAMDAALFTDDETCGGGVCSV
jgi:ribonucleoside-diphosphate reductase alpha chain